MRRAWAVAGGCVTRAGARAIWAKLRPWLAARVELPIGTFTRRDLHDLVDRLNQRGRLTPAA